MLPCLCSALQLARVVETDLKQTQADDKPSLMEDELLKMCKPCNAAKPLTEASEAKEVKTENQ